MPPAPLKIMMNVANPDRAFDFGMLPNAGIGLARLEMIIASHIGVHPKALLEYDDRRDAATKAKIDARTAGYAGPVKFTWTAWRRHRHHHGIRCAEPGDRAPVRLQVNEYANLIGGKYEPHEENPMIGFRGALALHRPELQGRVRAGVQGGEAHARPWACPPVGDDPVRAHLTRGRKVLEVLRENGLAGRGRAKGDHDVRGALQCPAGRRNSSNFDGFSIGSNDMTQLTGPGPRFRDRRRPVRRTRPGGEEDAGDGDFRREGQGQITSASAAGAERPSDLALWLMERGIESVSLNPDTMVDTWLALAKAKAASIDGAHTARRRLRHDHGRALCGVPVPADGDRMFVTHRPRNSARRRPRWCARSGDRLAALLETLGPAPARRYRHFRGGPLAGAAAVHRPRPRDGTRRGGCHPWRLAATSPTRSCWCWSS